MSSAPSPLDLLMSRRFVVVDVETTGFGPASRICEIGAARIHDGEIKDTFQTIVDPCVPITNSHVHGITGAMAHGAPKFESALPELLEFASGAVFAAHNARFDIGALVAEQGRIDLAPVKSQPYICTVVLGRAAYPGLGSYRLEALTTALGIVNANPHQGLSDAIVTAEALIELVAILKRKGGLVDDKFARSVVKQTPIFTDRLPLLFDKAELKPRV